MVATVPTSEQDPGLQQRSDEREFDGRGTLPYEAVAGAPTDAVPAVADEAQPAQYPGRFSHRGRRRLDRSGVPAAADQHTVNIDPQPPARNTGANWTHERTGFMALHRHPTTAVKVLACPAQLGGPTCRTQNGSLLDDPISLPTPGTHLRRPRRSYWLSATLTERLPAIEMAQCCVVFVAFAQTVSSIVVRVATSPIRRRRFCHSMKSGISGDVPMQTLRRLLVMTASPSSVAVSPSCDCVSR